MKLFWIALFWLAGCATTVSTTPTQPSALVDLEKFSMGDLATAAALGIAAGDPNGPRCWAYLSKVVPAIQPPAELGVATAVEIARISQLDAAAAACGAMGLPVSPAAIAKTLKLP